MAMNEEEMTNLMAQQQPQMGQPQMDAQQQQMGMEPQSPFPSSNAEFSQQSEQPNPMDTLSTVVTSYMDYAVGVKNNPQLNEQVRSQIMLQMAQAINYFVPLLQNDKEAELQLKREEHQMNMEMKQMELQFKQQEHEMKLQHSQAENQLKIQQTQQQNEMNNRHREEQHQANIVQSHQGHQQKMEQGQQAAQLKQGSKQGNNPSK